MKVRLSIIRLVVLCLLCAAAAPAFAVPPVQLSSQSQLTDQAGVIADDASVERELDSLRDREQVQMFVAYVDSFDGMPAQQWADATARQNGLGDNDLLLAVAVQDRQYAWNVGQGFPLSDAELREWAAQDVEPRLQAGDWAGASVEGARGLEQQIGGGIGAGVGGVLAAIACLGVLVAIGLVVFFAVRAARKRAGAGGPAGQPVAPAMPTDELAKRAGALLVEMDDALETSEQDVGFAEAEFGADAAKPFRETVERARADVAEAFRLQQRLTDATPESDQERRAVLTEIIQRCERADSELDAHAARFEELRARAQRAPEIAGAVESAVDATGKRVGSAEDVLERLRGAYPASALTPIGHAPEQARERLRFATTSVAEARAAIEAGDASKAAGILSAAEEATAQAARLLDAVDKTAAQLEAAKGRLEAGLGDMRQDIAAAEALPANTPEAAVLAADLSTARAAQGTVAREMSSARYDPFALLHRLETAAVPLDAALASYAKREEQAARARQRLDDVIAATRARIAAVHDFIATNRGGVGADARAALAEAQARLGQAEALRDTDPLRALQHAESAAAYAERALREAEDDVRGFGGEDLGDIGTMILGGILLGHMAGGMGRHGGFGGFGPGFFGGSGSRRGGGGRF